MNDDSSSYSISASKWAEKITQLELVDWVSRHYKYKQEKTHGCWTYNDECGTWQFIPYKK